MPFMVAVVAVVVVKDGDGHAVETRATTDVRGESLGGRRVRRRGRQRAASQGRCRRAVVRVVGGEANGRLSVGKRKFGQAAKKPEAS